MHAYKVRIVGRMDLPAINAIVEQAVASWDVTERVKRLAMPDYQYRREDMDHMWLLAAQAKDGKLWGFAALEEADSAELPAPGPGLLMHGLFVQPAFMRAGIGTHLLRVGAGVAKTLGYKGMLVKSVRQSRRFFERNGLLALRAEKATDYPYRYWLALGESSLHTGDMGDRCA